MNKLFISFLTVLGLLVFMPISVAYAAGFGVYAIRTGSEYNSCPYSGQYYYGSWAGTNGCKGGDWTLNYCEGSWCPTLNRSVMNDQPQYSYNFDDKVSATVQPRFPNGQNTPDGAVFDHWETRSIDDYQGTKPSQTGTSLPANITIYHPYHNGLWFFYKSPPPPPNTYTTPGSPSCISPANGATNVNPNSVVISWGASAGGAYYYYRLDNLTTNRYDYVVKDALTNTFDNPRELDLGTTYQYRVWARNTSPSGSPNAYSTTTTCTFTTMASPTMGSLSIGPSPDDGAVSSSTRISGLRSDQGGNNTNNAVLVTRNSIGNQGTATLIGAAFGGSSLSNSSLYELTKSAQQNNGVVVIYAKDSTSTYGYSTPYKTTSNWDGMITFEKNSYYAYSGATGEWKKVTTDTYLINNYNWIWQGKSSNPDSPSFNVRFYSPVGNRNWVTYGYLRDIAGNHYTQPF